MKRILLNADIGERGADHPIDNALMACLDIANVACGGHAGDAASVAAFLALADRYHVATAAHLSYPDPARFGRVTMHLPWPVLRDSLDAQLALLPDARTVKFHGALYHDSGNDSALARQLTAWLAAHHIATVLAFPGS